MHEVNERIGSNLKQARDAGKVTGAVAIVTLLVLAAAWCLPSRVSGATERIWAHDSTGVTAPAPTWYLAEGCTAPGFETWVLVQNPGDTNATIDMRLQSDGGEIAGPQDTVPPHSRRSYNLGSYLESYNVSTLVSSNAPVVCERAMYGNNRTWAHDSTGVTAPAPTWYLAEGCTAPGFETWVLVQNPGDTNATIDMRLQSDGGEIAGPQDTVPPHSRRSYNLGSYLESYNVSTLVSSNAPVVCERAMYGNNRTWAHDSTGVTAPAPTWYLAEGCTAPGFETWVLVQNPGDTNATIDMRLQSDGGEIAGPQDTVPPHSRRSYNLGSYLESYNVSTLVSSNAPVVCERAMYGNNRTWAHDSTGVTAPAPTWYLAEGCTAPGFETWVLVQNPGDTNATIDMRLQSDGGEIAGPQDTVPPHSRRSYNLGSYLESYNVSTLVSSNAPVVCERAMYGLREEAVVCLDPGHADTPDNIDPDTGLNTRDWANSPEIEIVYDIASRARAILEANGVSVVMTKQSVDDPVDLKQRAVIANQAGAALIVHVHTDPEIAGPTTFYPGPAPYNWKANSDTERTAYIDPAVQAASEYQAPLFHQAMYAYLRSLAEIPDGGTVVENRGATGTGNYGPIFSYDIWSRVPTLTLENNQTFADAHRQEVAEAIAAGILAFLRNR